MKTRNKIEIEKRQFFYLILVLTIRYFKNLFGVFFGLLFPIIWLIASYFIWGKWGKPEEFTSIYTTFSLLPAASLGLMSFPISFGSDRILNLNKFYATINVSQEKYFAASYIVIFIQFFIVTNIVLILGNFLFVKDALNASAFLLPAREYFSVLFTDVYAFTMCFFLSLGISKVGRSMGPLFSVAFAYYYLNLFISGIIIPTNVYDQGIWAHPNDDWFKWLQYITPMGSGARLDQNIVDPVFWTWSTDWLCFLSPIIQSCCALVLVYKFSSWRYHRSVRTNKFFLGSKIKVEK